MIPKLYIKHYALGIVLLAVLFGCTTEAERGQMRAGLDSINVLNRTDQPFTPDDVRPYVDFFDKEAKAFFTLLSSDSIHNDQLLAHYLLGRAYHEKGDAPMALESYQHAIDYADTTAMTDKDFAQLSRVYAQMADIFYQQNLMQDYLESIDRSVDYAWRAKDTIVALNEYVYKVVAYDRMMLYDSVVAVFDKVFNMLNTYYGEETAARYCAYPINAFIVLNKTEKAKSFLETYENKSGYFDANGNIDQGREIYYYYKGLYYMKVQKFDSAEHFFRRELNVGKNYNDQNAASRGLSLLYYQTHQPDSAAKYAIYAYAMNDSVYAQMATQEVEQAQAMYDYSRHQQKAQHEKERADRTSAKLRLFSFLFVVFALLSTGLLLFWRKKRRAAIRLYQEKKEELSKARADLARLQSNRITIDQVISEKEESIVRLQSEVENLKLDYRQVVASERQRNKENATYKKIQKNANSGQKLNSEEWKEIEQFMQEQQPEFCKFLSNSHIPFDDMGRHVCILLRLHFSIKSTGALLGVSGPRVSQISEVILNDLFGMNGSGKDLSLQLSKIC